MSSSMSIKTAVSDYEYLNSKHRQKYLAENKPKESSDDDENLLSFLKAAQVSSNKYNAFREIADINNSNMSKKVDGVGGFSTKQVKMLDDAVQSINKVPVPVAWSPGMRFKSDPSVFMTPQKSPAPSRTVSIKDTLMEPENTKNIPKPLAWSPGMVVQPDPNLFITPEKTKIKKTIPKIIRNKKEDLQNLDTQSKPTKTKEVHSVRFNLPPPASVDDDDSTKPSSDWGSPITLKGCDISMDQQSFDSPVWKTFSPQKMYNPNTYSDESSLDNTITSTLPGARDNSSYNFVTIHKTDSVSDNSSGRPQFIESNIPSLIIEGPIKLPNHQKTDLPDLATNAKMDTKSSTSNVLPLKTESSKSNISVSKKEKAHADKKIDEKSIRKAGPHFLSSPLTPYEPPRPEAAVIREADGNLTSAEYSFPFERRGASENLEYEHIFARPEFNSTLKVRTQLENLQEQEVDVMKVVEATLAKSEVKRLELNEKAAVYTNRTSRQFKNLIDLNTPEESLCERIVRMRTTLPCKKRGATIEKKSNDLHKAPDLMEFFSPDLQKESPDWSLPGVTRVTSQLMTSKPEVAFDLYRHNRLWLGINDF